MHIRAMPSFRRRATQWHVAECVGRRVMPQRIDDARQWRERAEEARDQAEQLKDPESKRILLGIAVSYVALAKIAEERDTARRKN